MIRWFLSLFKTEPLHPADLYCSRSPGWKKLRRQHLAKYPTCAACGGKYNVVPHHIVPVHVDASRELDEDNLITLCEGETVNCHLLFGHSMHWASWNVSVRFDAAVCHSRIEDRPAI